MVTSATSSANSQPASAGGSDNLLENNGTQSQSTITRISKFFQQKKNATQVDLTDTAAPSNAVSPTPVDSSREETAQDNSDTSKSPLKILKNFFSKSKVPTAAPVTSAPVMTDAAPDTSAAPVTIVPPSVPVTTVAPATNGNAASTPATLAPAAPTITEAAASTPATTATVPPATTPAANNANINANYSLQETLEKLKTLLENIEPVISQMGTELKRYNDIQKNRQAQSQQQSQLTTQTVSRPRNGG